MRLLTLFVFLIAGCAPSASDTPPAAPVVEEVRTEAPEPAVRVGAAVLADSGFSILKGKRVGLIVNHTAMVGGEHLIDLVHRAPGVELTALFGPEHGLRGTADAGAHVSDERDEKTGVRIYSLYGRTNRPTPEMLEEVDVLVFDVQDVGARFYTYISTMGLAMQAAAEARIEVVVLDRPNPLGGELVSGWLLDPAHTSFVGQYPIPVAHGMTVGELARMIQGERMLSGLENLNLTVVPMDGWTRSMQWPETGLPWIAPSPNIPDFETALVYPGSCFFEAASASEGRGTLEPFRLLGAPWADGQALADRLNGYGLPGFVFEPATFTPRSIEGMATNPRLAGRQLQGIHLVVSDRTTFKPVETGVHLLHAFLEQAKQERINNLIDRPDWLAKLAGTDSLYEMLQQGTPPDAIVETWRDDVEVFLQKRKPYLLYE